MRGTVAKYESEVMYIIGSQLSLTLFAILRESTSLLGQSNNQGRLSARARQNSGIWAREEHGGGAAPMAPCGRRGHVRHNNDANFAYKSL